MCIDMRGIDIKMIMKAIERIDMMTDQEIDMTIGQRIDTEVTDQEAQDTETADQEVQVVEEEEMSLTIMNVIEDDQEIIKNTMMTDIREITDKKDTQGIDQGIDQEIVISAQDLDLNKSTLSIKRIQLQNKL
jgi:hypothetical protein